ncbi:MAG TPA: toll/interleukin-1 receptor domain-containing protein [Blastocatellia bacterium]|nr:toll/interleukin-1 receptor domain-containing protein [Blastocatellia bacterium]
MSKAVASVFISYVQRDRASAERVIRAIRRRRPDIQVLNHFELSAAEPWVEKVRDWISRCKLFMVLLTPNSIEADNVLTEVGAAWGLGKPIVKIVPIEYVLGDRLPISLLGQPTLRLQEIEETGALDHILQQYVGSRTPEVSVETIG